MEKAKAKCTQLDSCGGLYDPGCDNADQGRIYLCQKGFSAGSSEDSCVYVKSGSGGNTNNNNRKPNNRNNNNRKPNNRNNRKPGGGGGSCLTKGSCSRTVDQCGHCLYNSQCKSGMFCCPFMKKCVQSGSTPCFYPIANCIPPCRESSQGYPNTCKCGEAKFPNDWMTSGTEAALGDGNEEGDDTDAFTSDELKDIFEEYKEYLVEKSNTAMNEEKTDLLKEEVDEIVDDVEEIITSDLMKDEADDDVITSDILAMRAREILSEEELAEFEKYQELGVGSGPSEIHHHHHHHNSLDRIIALFLGGICCGIIGKGWYTRNKKQSRYPTARTGLLH